ncbi:MAG: BON domain-containing protein [Acidobacteriota bacterium]|nr:BON domain-containing protein [Acidobacteriota bacterium]
MNRALSFGAGLGIGTAVMYLLDPDRGRRRRALLRDKCVSATRKTGEGIETTARDLSNRARGIATSIQSKFTSDDIDDAVLIDRVRSKLGRIVSHPGAIEVAAEDGYVTLSGPVLEGEVDNLLTRVKQVQGVNEVANALEVHKEAGNHPALQGGREPQGHQFEFLQENWSPAARFVAGAAGASLAVYGGMRRDALGAGLGAAGLLLLTRGITNTEFKRLAGLDEGPKTDDNRVHSDRDASSRQNVFPQSSAAMSGGISNRES